VTAVPGGLITLEYAAQGLQFNNVGTSSTAARDADLIAYIQAATTVIEDLVGPVLQVTKTVTFDGGVTGIVLPDKVSSITSVSEAGNVLPNTNWFFDPIANIVYGGNFIYPRPFYPGRLAVSITYVTGYATIPPTLQLATRELVRFWWQQGNAAQRPAYSDAVEATAPQGFAVPKRVIELCNAFRGPEVGFA
jgi:hypothetical protein